MLLEEAPFDDCAPLMVLTSLAPGKSKCDSKNGISNLVLLIVLNAILKMEFSILFY